MNGLSYYSQNAIDNLTVPARFKPEEEDRGALRSATGMWGVIDMNWTGQLAAQIGNRRCLEVFAGRGWLSQALASHGVDIQATSRFSGHDGSQAGLVHDVIDMSAMSAVQMFDFEVLIMCWPPATGDALKAAKEARRLGRDFDIVFIGEPYSDLPYALSGTADDAFFEACEVVSELKAYRDTRGSQGVDVCQWMRLKDDQ